MKRPKYKDKEGGDINVDELAAEIIKEINKVRSDPESYVKYLEKDKNYVKDSIVYRPNEDPFFFLIKERKFMMKQLNLFQNKKQLMN